MVVARDRYVAEDAAARIRVAYEPLPVVVDRGRSPRRTAHDDVAGQLRASAGARRRRRRAGRARRTCSSWRFEIERSAGMPLEARGVLARYDAADDVLLVHDSTQAPTGIRAGLALLFELDSSACTSSRRTSAAASARRSCSSIPRRCWSRGPRAGSACRSSGPRTAASTSSARTTSAGRSTTSRVGCRRRRPDPRAGDALPARQRRLLPVRADHPDHHRLAAARAVQAAELPLRVRRSSTRTRSRRRPYRGAGRPHGVFVMERMIDRDRPRARARPCGGPAPQLHPARRVPYDVGVTFQDGGADDLRLRRLPGRARPAAGEGRPARLRVRARRGASGRRLGIGLACYVEGTGIGPYEGAAHRRAGRRHVTVATGLRARARATRPMFAQIAADELGVDVADVAGHDRRHAPVRLRRRHVREPLGGRRRQRGPRGGGHGAPPGAGAGRAGARGRPRRHRAGRRASRASGARRAEVPLGQLAIAGQPAALRVRCPGRGGGPPRAPARGERRRVARGGRGAGPERRRATTARRPARTASACTRPSWRSTRTPATCASCATWSSTTAAA